MGGGVRCSLSDSAEAIGLVKGSVIEISGTFINFENIMEFIELSPCSIEGDSYSESMTTQTTSPISQGIISAKEIIKEFADKGVELMQKYHAGENWNIITSSLEDYFANHTEKYDIIFCWGVSFSQIDHAWFIKNLCERCDHMALNWRHPKVMWNDNQHEISDELWRKLEYDIPYQEWQEDEMTQTSGKHASVN